MSCVDWEGNPQNLGEETDVSRETHPTGDPIVYSPMESGWKMYSPRNLWRDGDIPLVSMYGVVLLPQRLRKPAEETMLEVGQAKDIRAPI
jgi:hypothetical protein